jgi:hypothetical protein
MSSNEDTKQEVNVEDNDKSIIEKDEILKTIIEDYEARFEMLVTQINEMKDTVMKLQTYTLDVNKKLLDQSGLLEGDENVPPLDKTHFKGDTIPTLVTIAEGKNEDAISTPESLEVEVENDAEVHKVTFSTDL